VSYGIPVLKVVMYDIETIFEKNLLFLLPFHIFCYEGELNEIEQNAERLHKLKELYSDIVRRLETMCMTGIIDEYTKLTICEMSEKVINNLAFKYQNIKKEVTSVMGGKVLEHQAKTIFLRGEASGELKGKIEGKIEEARLNAMELFRNGVSFEMVEKSIKSIGHEELLELYHQVIEN